MLPLPGGAFSFYFNYISFIFTASFESGFILTLLN